MSPPYRQLVDIGDRVVCARVLGQGPTVVLEAGGAGEGTTGAYGGLETRLAAFATVVTYDRAGSGRSDDPPHRSVAQMADDLHAVLRSLQCAAPVVIVGWSAGGLVAEMFAARHPDQVSGLVLLDPSEAAGSRILQAFGITVGTVWLWVGGLAALWGFFRTRPGRSLLRRMAPAGTSQERLEWLHQAISNPRAGLQTAQTMARIGRYLRETAAALNPHVCPMSQYAYSSHGRAPACHPRGHANSMQLIASWLSGSRTENSFPRTGLVINFFHSSDPT